MNTKKKAFHQLTVVVLCLLMVIISNAQNAQWDKFNKQFFDPDPGNTLVLIGQTWLQEYKDYVTATDKIPAGGSHYGELYSGLINQGNDWPDLAYLNYINDNYPGSYAEMAISIKDNPSAGGYSFDANGVMQACRDVVTGRWDSQIDQLAQTFKQYESIKWFVRIGYEVNTNLFGNQPEPYVSAYNYIAQRIRVHNQVSNVAFVYHPVRGENDVLTLYPGDEYVDWVGISIFNHDACVPTWEAVQGGPPFHNPGCNFSATGHADENTEKFMTWANNVVKKPIIIGEAACQTDENNQMNFDHYKTYFDNVFWMIENYDVGAFVYINSHWTQHNWATHWGDSRIQRLPQVQDLWMEEICKERYIHYPTGQGVPPTAAFSAEVNCLEVLFSSNSQNEPTSWLWDFGDGNTSTGENPVHTYAAAGTYTVKLTVQNDYGQDEEIKVDFLELELDPAPLASDEEVCAGESATLRASGGSGRYAWYDVPSGGNVLGTGITFETETLNQDKDYYVQSTGDCASEERTIVAVTVIHGSTIPLVDDVSVCENDSLYLNASGADNYFWYSEEGSKDILATGSVFQTVAPIITRTYFVSGIESGQEYNVGPVDNTFGGGNNYDEDRDDLGQLFDLSQRVLWKKARVYASGDGDRTFVIKDGKDGAEIASKTIFVEDGEQVVDVNIVIPPGVDLFMTVEGVANLYRNNCCVTYPYSNGPMTIKASTAQDAVNFYYYLYDLVIEQIACESEREAVQVFVDEVPDEPVILQDGTNLSVIDQYDSYQWYLDGELITGATNSNYTAQTNGLYHVVVKKGACEVESNMVDIVTSTKSVSMLSSITAFPNPAHNKITINRPALAKSGIYEIASPDGVLLKKGVLKEASEIIDLPVSEHNFLLLKLIIDTEVVMKSIVLD